MRKAVRLRLKGTIKSELTELKARDASCPKGKKMDKRIYRTIGISEPRVSSASHRLGAVAPK